MSAAIVGFGCRGRASGNRARPAYTHADQSRTGVRKGGGVYRQSPASGKVKMGALGGLKMRDMRRPERVKGIEPSCQLGKLALYH